MKHGRYHLKDIPTEAILLAVADYSRRLTRSHFESEVWGSGENMRWNEDPRLAAYPPKLVLLKAERMSMLEYGTSINCPWILSPTHWGVPDADRARLVAILTAEGHTFGDYKLADRPEDVAVRQAKKAAWDAKAPERAQHKQEVLEGKHGWFAQFMTMRRDAINDSMRRQFEHHLIFGGVSAYEGDES
jgi:hypothetical protein